MAFNKRVFKSEIIFAVCFRLKNLSILKMKFCLCVFPLMTLLLVVCCCCLVVVAAAADFAFEVFICNALQLNLVIYRFQPFFWSMFTNNKLCVCVFALTFVMFCFSLLLSCISHRMLFESFLTLLSIFKLQYDNISVWVSEKIMLTTDTMFVCLRATQYCWLNANPAAYYSVHFHFNGLTMN